MDVRFDEKSYDQFIKCQKRINSGYFRSLPKKKRIGAFLKENPYSSMWDVRAATGLYMDTIRKWYEENQVEEYVSPLTWDQQGLLSDLWLHGITVDDIKSFTYMDLFIKINKSRKVRGNLQPVLDHISELY